MPNRERVGLGCAHSGGEVSISAQLAPQFGEGVGAGQPLTVRGSDVKASHRALIVDAKVLLQVSGRCDVDPFDGRSPLDALVVADFAAAQGTVAVEKHQRARAPWALLRHCLGI
jgi:predicted phage tail protein